MLPDSGRVVVNDADTQTNALDVRRQVSFAVATERSFFPRLSARENLDFFAALDNVFLTARDQRTEELLVATSLLDAADTLVMKFSSGMYQRLGLARALMKRPPVLLLDEPTRSLDPAAAAHFWALTPRSFRTGNTIVITSHNFHEALAVGNELAILSRGKVAGHAPSPPSQPSMPCALFYFETTGESDELLAAEYGGRH